MKTKCTKTKKCTEKKLPNPKQKLTEKEFISNIQKSGLGIYEVADVSKRLEKLRSIEELLGVCLAHPVGVKEVKKKKYLCNTKSGQLKKGLTLSEILKRKDILSIENFKIQL